ncbi:helix-turn-helix domain-containing protein [Geomonas nitrogeniifigens]|uniref:helix-turn-helix domain-containing protein n=1 Tax=Geomonas diazotrophica TaxID=2843197 RepID=UPI001C2C7AAB|nr:helix-turn-helix transcriptional regulator [Geomonas nitrogeniifigens]QXE86010.1 helix-turn-helix domain-containing protein [Geomonas nitrogeniifigens]
MSKVGENIKRLRENARWTQSDLANITKISKQYISAVERGERNPKPETISKFAEAFAVDEAVLVKDIDADLKVLQDEVERLFTKAKATSPLDKHHFMAELLEKLRAIENERP